jgi:hypothetical protein
MRAAFDEVVTKISANQATPAFKAKIADLFDKATVRFSASLRYLVSVNVGAAGQALSDFELYHCRLGTAVR